MNNQNIEIVVQDHWYRSIREFGTWLVARPRYQKRLVLGAIDFCCLLFALWLALSLRFGTFYVPPDLARALILGLAPVLGVAIFAWFGLYRLVTRYIGSKGTRAIAICMALSVLIWSLAILMSQVKEVPRSVIFAYALIGGGMVYANRQAAAFILNTAGIPLPLLKPAPRAVAIYGAGQICAQLVSVLRQSGELRPVGLLDEGQSMWGQYVSGLKIYPPEKLSRLIEREGVSEVILAEFGNKRRRLKEIIEWLQAYPVQVRIMPDMTDIVTGRVTVNDLRPVGVEDLLGRDSVAPISNLLKANVEGKAVIITGAGGSIGSELARQVVRQRPRCLILFDQAEPALYHIEDELTQSVAAMQRSDTGHSDQALPRIIPILGNVLDGAYFEQILKFYSVETIYHAAAYKHVPIVEKNPIIGLRNNTFGTRVVAAAAQAANVERMVLISTDKAVRPTNVMGASKRLAELVVQAEALQHRCPTTFSIVRFGNVLDSSGSVVRKFRRQIEDGGPVTVTDPNVMRYFMSIPEAAELVIQAGAMAQGGEVFVLEMGETVRIADLARTMIRVMGREVKDKANPDGDIEIEFIGLRPGEKLIEELLVDGEMSATEHPRIYRNAEPFVPLGKLERELDNLLEAIRIEDFATIRNILCELVDGYVPHEETFSNRADILHDFHVSRSIH
ncbi:MAG: nucleoside-diphosphate sugar epimerase/dehydratase [Pseudomonadota bacterium]